jgi:hypothetical protein
MTHQREPFRNTTTMEKVSADDKKDDLSVLIAADGGGMRDIARRRMRMR